MNSQLISSNTAIDELYAVIKKAENKVGGGEGLSGIYGSITQAGMREVLNKFQEHSGLGPDSVFVDIGAGLGRPLLHAICACRVHKAIGIELDAVKCQKAVPFLQHVVDHMANYLSARSACKDPQGDTVSADRACSGTGISDSASPFGASQLAACGADEQAVAPEKAQLSCKPTIVCASIEEIQTLHPATHAYAAWEGFPETTKRAVGRLFAASPTLRAITIVQRSFRQLDPAEEMGELEFGPVRLTARTDCYLTGSRRHLNAYMFVKTKTSSPPRRQRLASTTAAAASLYDLPTFDPSRAIDVISSQAETSCPAQAIQGSPSKDGSRDSTLSDISAATVAGKREGGGGEEAPGGISKGQTQYGLRRKRKARVLVDA